MQTTRFKGKDQELSLDILILIWFLDMQRTTLSCLCMTLDYRGEILIEDTNFRIKIVFRVRKLDEIADIQGQTLGYSKISRLRR